MSRFHALLGALVIVGAFARPASAIYIRHDVDVSEYAALAADPLFSATGYLRGPLGGRCTGTLVSPTQVLSSAHCFPPSPTSVMFGFESIVPSLFVNNVAAVTVHPLFVSGSTSTFAYDLAIATLASPVSGVTPAALWSGDPLGLLGTLVGYGLQGDGLHMPIAFTTDRLAAQNVIDTIAYVDMLTLDFDCARELGNCSTYGSDEPERLEGATATGDSGGPLFIMLGGTPFLVGTLYGSFYDAYGDISYYARIAREENVAFLRSQGLTVNGPGDAVPEPGTATLLVLGLAATWLATRQPT